MLVDLIESVNNISLFFITESQRKLFLITIVITDKQNVHSHQKKKSDFSLTFSVQSNRYIIRWIFNCIKQF